MLRQIEMYAQQWDVQRRLLRRGFTILAIGLLLSKMITAAHAQPLRLFPPVGTRSSSGVQSDQGVRQLEPDKPIERELTGGQAHSHHIALSAGQYMRVVVEQRGIDVVVTLFGPDGRKIVGLDSREGTQGPEPVCVVAGASGTYRIEVRSREESAQMGRYEVRIEDLRSATEQDSDRIAAQTAFTEGMQLQAQDDAESLPNAIRKYEKALSLYRATGDRYGEAHTLSGLGWVYGNLNETHKALDYNNQALALHQAIGDRGGEAYTLGEIAWTYRSFGQAEMALDYYNQALALHRAVGDRRGEAITLICMGLIYREVDEKQKALDYYNQALTLVQETGYRFGEGFALGGIGRVYGDLGEKQKALDYYNRALLLYRAGGSRRGEAHLLDDIGGVYASLGEKQKALDYYNQALLLYRAVSARLGEAYALANMGWVYDSLGDKQKALEYYHQALLLSRAVDDRAGVAYALHSIGWVYDSLGEKQKALDYYNQALLLRRAVGFKSGEAATLYRLACLEQDRGNLIEAHAHIEAALSIIESLRAKVGSQELRASYVASIGQYYEFYIDLLFRQNQLSPFGGNDAAALYASERARARSLLELLTESRADIRQGVDARLLEREQDLQRLITAGTNRRVRLLNTTLSVSCKLLILGRALSANANPILALTRRK